MTRDDVAECFDPGFLTICHHTLIVLPIGMSAIAAAVALQSGSSRRDRAVAVWFSLGQHGPEDTGGFGGERHHHDLVRPAREQLAPPLPELPLEVGQELSRLGGQDVVASHA